jgi:hypothetical protein
VWLYYSSDCELLEFSVSSTNKPFTRFMYVESFLHSEPFPFIFLIVSSEEQNLRNWVKLFIHFSSFIVKARELCVLRNLCLTQGYKDILVCSIGLIFLAVTLYTTFKNKSMWYLLRNIRKVLTWMPKAKCYPSFGLRENKLLITLASSSSTSNPEGHEKRKLYIVIFFEKYELSLYVLGCLWHSLANRQKWFPFKVLGCFLEGLHLEIHYKVKMGRAAGCALVLSQEEVITGGYTLYVPLELVLEHASKAKSPNQLLSVLQYVQIHELHPFPFL